MPLTLSALPAPLDQPGGTEPPVGGPFEGLLRSKGFIWLDCSHSVAYHWSQAGRYVQMEEMGRWWAAVPAESRPARYEASIQEDFEGEWGDRRQELVFIGMDLPEAEIRAALNSCLLTDVELDALRAKVEEGAGDAEAVAP